MKKLKVGDLFAPTIVISNKKGETIFSMKRKDQHGPVYYIYEVFRDRMDEEQYKRFSAAFNIIKEAAALMEIPLYDFIEIQAKLELKMQELAEEMVKNRQTGIDRDVQIDLIDQATGEPMKLTIGVTMKGEKNEAAI